MFVNKKVDGLQLFFITRLYLFFLRSGCLLSLNNDYFICPGSDYSIKGWWSQIILYNQALHSTERWLILDMKRSVMQRGHVGRQIVSPLIVMMMMVVMAIVKRIRVTINQGRFKACYAEGRQWNIRHQFPCDTWKGPPENMEG